VTRKCESCRYWFAGGQCRRRPPIMRGELVKVDGANSLAAYGADDGVWPRARADDFCGEYREDGGEYK
jgi:hypothetical protein